MSNGITTKHPISDHDDGHGYVTEDLDPMAFRSPPRKDRIIAVQPLKREEMQSSYAQDLGAGSVQHGIYGSFINGLGTCIGTFGALPFSELHVPYSPAVLFPTLSSKEVQQGTVGLVSRFGNFYKAVDPGLVQVNVCTESLRVVDVKIQIVSIGRQTVITRDNVNVAIDSVIYYQIVNPYRAAFCIADLQQALVERAQTTLRHVVGARTVQSVVVERETIALEIDSILSEVGDKWGVAIEGVLIKDIIFSHEVAASLSSAAQQKRIGEAKVIAAKAEVEAARLMRQAADILASPAAMQIRQLDALQGMAKTSSSKVIFVPMNLQSDVIGQIAAQQQQRVADGMGEGGSINPTNLAYTAGTINSIAMV
ncbi:hypothetical protein DL93DRAFT_2165988 [Clavulina sp. PMI_390]|nr:hypothetical protein DL93DRAFT_2165988 [Clavulina sp. PMI_390]